MRHKLFAVLMLGLMLAAALPLMAQDPGPDLSGTTWEWVQTVTPVETITATDPARYNIVFAEDGSVAVQLDCNRGFGSYTREDGTLSISIVGSTMAMCPEDSQAAEFTQQLNNAAGYFFQDGSLFIDQAMDSGTMQFRPIPASLTGVTWEWTGTTGGDEDVTVADPTSYLVAFADDGMLNFTADCNVGNGTYVAGDDNALSITLGATTLAMCPEDSQDMLFTEQLGLAASYELGFGVMDVTLTDGRVMSFRAGGTAAPPDASLLLGTTWQWFDLQQANVSEAVTPPESYTIEFNADGTAFIVADCNTSRAEFTAADGSITMSVGATTMMACPEESRSSQFLELLGQVTTYDVTVEGYLELYTAEGYRLTLKPGMMGEETPMAEPVLTGTTWEWVQTMTSDETIVAVDPARYTLTFNEDGTYGMRVDCNTGGGSFTTEDGALTIGPGMMTLMGCPEDTQDSIFLDQINRAAVYYFVDGHLFIELAEASGIMEFRPAQPALTGVNWQWQQTVTPVETIVASDPASYVLVFNDDGSVNVTADCNTGFGDFTVDGQSISIGPLGTTRMACPEGSQDTAFLTQLQNAAVFFFLDGDLYIDQAMDSGTLQFSAAQ
jgi:heat shock protein HslJ